MEKQRVSRHFTQEVLRKIALEAPYVDTMRREAKAKIEGHDRSLSLIFNTINNQAIDSFHIFHSEEFEGVSFSALKLTVTPELIDKLSQDPEKFTSNQQEERNPNVVEDAKEQGTRNQTWFIEPAFGAGDIGNAFSALDMGIDRFIREMPKVARAMKEGEIPPIVDIYVLGSPISLGGTVTKEWADEVSRSGFDAHGKIYAEFVDRHVGEDLDNTRVVVSGPSRGSVTAERTFHFLPEEIKDHAQGLYDIPAGGHSRILPVQAIKGANMIGMGVEFAARVVPDMIQSKVLRQDSYGKFSENSVVDQTSRDLSRTEGPFNKELRKIKGIPEDTKEQTDLKTKALLAEIKALIKGTPIAGDDNFEERGYYRAPAFDPVNLKIEGMFDRSLSFLRRSPFAFRSKGNKLIASTSRKAHNFPWKRSFVRWEQAIEYCENIS